MKRVLAFVSLVVGLVLLLAGPAAADGEPVAAKTGTVITMSIMVWTVLQGTVLPIVVGLLTRVEAPDVVKVLLNLFLNALGAVVATITVVDGVAVLSTTTLVTAILGYISSIAVHYGFYRPFSVTGSTPETNSLWPERGLG